MLRLIESNSYNNDSLSITKRPKKGCRFVRRHFNSAAAFNNLCSHHAVAICSGTHVAASFLMYNSQRIAICKRTGDISNPFTIYQTSILHDEMMQTCNIVFRRFLLRAGTTVPICGELSGRFQRSHARLCYCVICIHSHTIIFACSCRSRLSLAC